VDAPSTWNLSHSSLELATLEFTHVEWLHVLDHVVIDANGLIIWDIVGSYVIDVNVWFD
jgi:hypothetical protein